MSGCELKMEMWQLLTKDIEMEEMLQLKLWTRESQDREFVNIVLYPRGYIVEAKEDDIEDFCSNANWVEKLIPKVDYECFVIFND